MRFPREFRRGTATPVSVVFPPPAYQPIQIPYAQPSQSGLHIQTPPGTTVQPYVAGPGVFTPIVYSPVDGNQPPAVLNAPPPNLPYYGPQQPVPQASMVAAPFYTQDVTQAGIYGQGPRPASWHAANFGHMSCFPQPAEPRKPTLRQRLMRMIRLPAGHASTVSESAPSQRNVSIPASPYHMSTSRRSSPARPTARRLSRGARVGHHRYARTVSPGPRRGIYSYRLASPKSRPRSQSPRYVHRGYRRTRSAPGDSSSYSSTSSSSCCSPVRRGSRFSDRT